MWDPAGGGGSGALRKRMLGTWEKEPGKLARVCVESFWVCLENFLYYCNVKDIMNDLPAPKRGYELNIGSLKPTTNGLGRSFS